MERFQEPLFTIGLKELNLDGTPKLDSSGNFIPTYTQNDVVELSKVFTGWDFQDVDGSSRYGSTAKNDNSQVVPLEFTAEYHEFGAKTVLGETIPANLEGEADIDRALDILFANANVAPYISRHLIMRLVTSNPSPAYVGRVATVFNNNGQGVKGDLKAVVKAILMDSEARGGATHFGKVDEMLLTFTHFLSAFDVKPMSNWKFWNGSASDKVMTNKYWLNPYKKFEQAPLSASSVFNFYSPEFVPSSQYFADNSLVAPELQIQNTPTLIGFSNTLYDFFQNDKYRVINLGLNGGDGYTNMDDWVASKNKGKNNQGHMYIDLTDEYTVFEEALDGDSNGDFANIDDATQLDQANRALVNHLDTHLLGGTMPEDYKTQLITHLNTIHKANNKWKAQFIVPTAIRAIVTSPLYMVSR